jgi:H/ACA ribonucleoprotein complex subunit 4
LYDFRSNFLFENSQKKTDCESAMASIPLSREQVASAQVSGDYAIKSEEKQPQLDTSQWPLLLKGYDKLLVRSSHFTPIPSGCSPLKRDIESYVK